MLLSWSTVLCLAILTGAFTLTMLNVIVVGGFVGRAITLHADLENLKGRKSARDLLAFNTVLAFGFLILLILYAGQLGWKSYSSYAISKGCDLSGKPEASPDA
jgi:hypothetical protein